MHVYRLFTHDFTIDELLTNEEINNRMAEIKAAGVDFRVYSGWVDFKPDFLLDDPNNIRRLKSHLRSDEIDARDRERVERKWIESRSVDL